MPTISMFYDILTLMCYRDNRRHHLPHVHVHYQGDEAAVSIEEGVIIEGALPNKQPRTVQAWIKIHKEALMINRELVVSGEQPLRIPPLQ